MISQCTIISYYGWTQAIFYCSQTSVWKRFSHGELLDADGKPIFQNTGDDAIENNCYQCHPGKTVKCQRGVTELCGVAL